MQKAEDQNESSTDILNGIERHFGVFKLVQKGLTTPK
jgi:hypothetical protein